MTKIVAFTPFQVDMMYSPLGKSVNISVQNRLRKNGKYSNIINENNMSALNNYLEKTTQAFALKIWAGIFFMMLNSMFLSAELQIQRHFHSVLKAQKRILETACARFTKMLKMP